MLKTEEERRFRWLSKFIFVFLFGCMSISLESIRKRFILIWYQSRHKHINVHLFCVRPTKTLKSNTLWTIYVLFGSKSSKSNRHPKQPTKLVLSFFMTWIINVPSFRFALDPIYFLCIFCFHSFHFGIHWQFYIWNGLLGSHYVSFSFLFVLFFSFFLIQCVWYNAQNHGHFLLLISREQLKKNGFVIKYGEKKGREN